MKAPSVVGASKFSQYSNRLNRLGSRDISGIYILYIYRYTNNIIIKNRIKKTYRFTQNSNIKFSQKINVRLIRRLTNTLRKFRSK